MASAITKQLITWQITAITVRCGQTRQWEARGGTVRCGWHWGAGASANKSPISKIISVHKQIEADGDRKAFLGHSAKQINHLFSYAVWVAVAGISGEPFVCLWSWCAEQRSMIVAPGRDFTAVRCLFSMTYSIHPTVSTCSLLFSLLPPPLSKSHSSSRNFSPWASYSSNSPLDKVSSSGPA